jgi:small-conductance mechanosensitive channel
MNIQQEINLGIFDAFAERGIGFAYPTHTVYVAGNAEPVRQQAGFRAPSESGEPAESGGPGSGGGPAPARGSPLE